MLLGCIADDFTGATDLANNLVRGGMRAIQTIGVPAEPIPDEVDAVVVALKSRTIAAREAVAQSLAALEWLQRHGCRQIYFKYCSTFDSTPADRRDKDREQLPGARIHPGGSGHRPDREANTCHEKELAQARLGARQGRRDRDDGATGATCTLIGYLWKV